MQQQVCMAECCLQVPLAARSPARSQHPKVGARAHNISVYTNTYTCCGLSQLLIAHLDKQLHTPVCLQQECSRHRPVVRHLQSQPKAPGTQQSMKMTIHDDQPHGARQPRGARNRITLCAKLIMHSQGQHSITPSAQASPGSLPGTKPYFKEKAGAARGVVCTMSREAPCCAAEPCTSRNDRTTGWQA